MTLFRVIDPGLMGVLTFSFSNWITKSWFFNRICGKQCCFPWGVEWQELIALRWFQQAFFLLKHLRCKAAERVPCFPKQLFNLWCQEAAQCHEIIAVGTLDLSVALLYSFNPLKPLLQSLILFFSTQKRTQTPKPLTEYPNQHKQSRRHLSATNTQALLTRC